MMVDTRWLTLSETVLVELKQSEEEGHDVVQYTDEAVMIYQMFLQGHLMEREAKLLLQKIKNAPIRAGYEYIEYSDLKRIRQTRPTSSSKPSEIPEKSILLDKIYGAWLGRCCGCLLGQPVEGWMHSRIIGLMKDTGNYPPTSYLSSNISPELRMKYKVTDEGRVYGSNHINWINNVSYMPEDDDTNYTVLNMKTIEEFGKNFTPAQMAHSWMMNMQFLHACTAERVAYKNFVNSHEPPYSGVHDNAYREWIGAQIRADLFGYISPGNPEKAAEMAWKDASISHTKNGIYGEMFVAAMLARCAVSGDLEDIIRVGLGEIPEKSRLFSQIITVLEWYKTGLTVEQAIEKIHCLFDESNSHDWCHTISNAMICVISLLWGKCDLEKTMGISVSAGFDTDCNGATVGSIIGMILGANNLPTQWVSPLQDTIISGIDGFGKVNISELAKRTFSLAMHD